MLYSLAVLPALLGPELANQRVSALLDLVICRRDPFSMGSYTESTASSRPRQVWRPTAEPRGGISAPLRSALPMGPGTFSGTMRFF